MTIIVAGLGRCGTTLLMQMLDAAGAPTIGQAPDWEDVDNVRLLERDPDGWATAARGKAVKLLDAHRFALPRLDATLIWLQRDPREQAKSMLKLLNSAFQMVEVNRSSIRSMEASLRRDTVPAVRNAHAAFGQKGYALQFERILAEPMAMAQLLCVIADLPAECAPAMAALVHRRSPACLPYLAEALV